MAKANPSTILLKGRGIRKEGTVHTGTSVMPGHLVIRTSTNTYRPHNAAAQNASPVFAVENELIGKGIDTAYVAGDNVVVEAMPTGAEVYALVAAAAAAVAVGDFLESAGDGTLRKLSTSASTAQTARNSVVAVALEAVDNSAGGSAARIQVEIV